MSIIHFLKSKTFLIHVVLAFAFAIAVLWFALKLLDIYTMHGKTITVPDLKGIETEEAIQILEDNNLRAVINDSVFDSTREKGTISSQNPDAGKEVKKNRTVYLTTIAILPEMVEMPDLNDLSLRQALAILDNYGLRAGKLEYVPNIARDNVLQQKYNNGTIEPGTLIEKGTAIDLELGTGESGNLVTVPFMVGKPREEAILLLNQSSLNIGEEVFLDDEESEDLRVYRQNPGMETGMVKLQRGKEVDLFYRSAENFDFEEYMMESLAVPTPDLTGKSPEEVFEILRQNSMILGRETFENNVPERRARVYKQEPQPEDNEKVVKGTTFDIWYKDVDDMEDQEE